MVGKLFKKIFGSRNDRLVKAMRKLVTQINDFESGLQSLSDEQLKAKTDEFRKRLDDGEILDMLLPEAFAVVREASQRTLGLRHYDVQMIGGMVLHDGKISEMRTGEGKTLMSTLPAYLNALTGKGVHVITVNDYLATRDSEWMGQLFNFLGMSVGVRLGVDVGVGVGLGVDVVTLRCTLTGTPASASPSISVRALSITIYHLSVCGIMKLYAFCTTLIAEPSI